jgi:hypothetical protein
VDHDLSVEAAGPQERWIKHIWPVGGRQHDHSLVPGEFVHLGQDLIESLLSFIVAADGPRAAARAAHRVDLVDEDDRGRRFPCLGEELADATAPTPTIISMNSDALALKNGTFASPAVARASNVFQSLALRPIGRLSEHAHPDDDILPDLQEVDDLVDLRLHFVDPGNIIKGDTNSFWIDAFLLSATENATHRLLLTPEHPRLEPDQQQNRRK